MMPAIPQKDIIKNNLHSMGVLFSAIRVAFITSLIPLILMVSPPVAIDTIKGGVIIRVGMAFGTIVPDSPVFSAIYGEILAIVIKGSWGPSRVRRMARHAIRGKVGCKMIRIGGLVIVVLMAIHAFWRGIGVVPGGMALGTILDVMAKGKREKVVVNLRRGPAGVGGMAIHTICGETGALVVGVLGSRVVVLVAIHAFWRSVRIVPCGMALVAVLDIMTLCKREKIVIDHSRRPPRTGGMAGDTIRGETGTLVVGVLRCRVIVLVATHTLRRSVGVVSGGMALGTILDIMALGKREKVVVDVL